MGEVIAIQQGRSMSADNKNMGRFGLIVLGGQPDSSGRETDLPKNILVQGIDAPALGLGARLKIGETIAEIVEFDAIAGRANADAPDVCSPAWCVKAKLLLSGAVAAGDAAAEWQGFSVGIITASDKGSRGEREDLSAAVIRELAGSIGGVVFDYRILPDEELLLAQAMRDMSERVVLLLTTGGTGFSPRDVTPEATKRVIEREAPGLTEAIRRDTGRTSPRAMLSRATAGIRGKTLIVNLPGSPRGVEECLSVLLPVLPHALEILSGRGGECARPRDAVGQV